MLEKAIFQMDFVFHQRGCVYFFVCALVHLTHSSTGVFAKGICNNVCVTTRKTQKPLTPQSTLESHRIAGNSAEIKAKSALVNLTHCKTTHSQLFSTAQALHSSSASFHCNSCGVS